MARFAPLARLPRPARRTVRILSPLLVLALILGLYAGWTVRRSFPERDGTLTVKGLSADATVLRDRWGVPQIYADTAEDLVRAQGYVHAQDRFWDQASRWARGDTIPMRARPGTIRRAAEHTLTLSP
jgi:penicillin amidase